MTDGQVIKSLWDAGLNTNEIAHKLSKRESDVSLHLFLERCKRKDLKVTLRDAPDWIPATVMKGKYDWICW